MRQQETRGRRSPQRRRRRGQAHGPSAVDKVSRCGPACSSSRSGLPVLGHPSRGADRRAHRRRRGCPCWTQPACGRHEVMARSSNDARMGTRPSRRADRRSAPETFPREHPACADRRARRRVSPCRQPSVRVERPGRLPATETQFVRLTDASGTRNVPAGTFRLRCCAVRTGVLVVGVAVALLGHPSQCGRHEVARSLNGCPPWQTRVVRLADVSAPGHIPRERPAQRSGTRNVPAGTSRLR